VPIGQRTIVRVSGQILLKPLALRGTGPASTGVATIRVQCDQVPGANVETVVALALVAGRRSEISKVTVRGGIRARTIRAARGKVLVVPHRGTCDRFDTPPTQIIGLQPGLIASAVILIISQQQDSRQIGIDKQIRSVPLPTGV
jgi:hypothetical protein